MWQSEQQREIDRVLEERGFTPEYATADRCVYRHRRRLRPEEITLLLTGQKEAPIEVRVSEEGWDTRFLYSAASLAHLLDSRPKGR